MAYVVNVDNQLIFVYIFVVGNIFGNTKTCLRP